MMEVTTVQPLLLLFSIRVDGAWDVEFMTHLESLNALKLLHFFMDLANITWSHIFTHPIVCRPMVDVCQKIIDNTCLWQLSINLEGSGLEEGAYIICIRLPY